VNSIIAGTDKTVAGRVTCKIHQSVTIIDGTEVGTYTWNREIYCTSICYFVLLRI
jgi:hypothetical protein